MIFHVMVKLNYITVISVMYLYQMLMLIIYTVSSYRYYLLYYSVQPFLLKGSMIDYIKLFIGSIFCVCICYYYYFPILKEAFANELTLSYFIFCVVNHMLSDFVPL